MPLRTYPLIAHPAFLAFVEHQKGADHGLHETKPVHTPTHRPAIKNITDIADYLQISHFFLRSIMRKPIRHYRQFQFNKRSGGVRTIHAPRTFLKVIQWWILDTILYNAEISPIVHGFTPYKSFITNAKEHVGARHILNVDIKDFFPSIKTSVVIEVFASLGYSEKISVALANLTTFQGALPQGAPTSPAIANLALRLFDKSMLSYAELLELKYTRYADDLTFSSSTHIDPQILGVIRAHLEPLGLELNEKKTRFVGSNSTKEVTGLILGRDGVRLSARFMNSARGWFHKISKSPSQYRENLDRIRGTLSLIEQVGGAGSSKIAVIGRRAVAKVRAEQMNSSED